MTHSFWGLSLHSICLRAGDTEAFGTVDDQMVGELLCSLLGAPRPLGLVVRFVPQQCCETAPCFSSFQNNHLPSCSCSGEWAGWGTSASRDGLKYFYLGVLFPSRQPRDRRSTMQVLSKPLPQSDLLMFQWPVLLSHAPSTG